MGRPTDNWAEEARNRLYERSEASRAKARRKYAEDPEYRARVKRSQEKSLAKARLNGIKYKATVHPVGVTHPKDLPVLKNGFVKWW